MIFQYPDPSELAAGVPRLRVEVVGDRGTVLVTVRGEIDLATAELLDAGVTYALRGRPARLVVDLSEVGFFGAAGLRALLAGRNEAAGCGVDLALEAPSESVRRVLELSRTQAMFRVERNPPAALRTGMRQSGPERRSAIMD